MNTVAFEKAGMRMHFVFVIMASAVIVTVFAGFAPSFYLRGSFTQNRPMSFLLHLHGIVFSAWVIIFLVQTLLIERGSQRLHQRLGWIAVGVADDDYLGDSRRDQTIAPSAWLSAATVGSGTQRVRHYRLFDFGRHCYPLPKSTGLAQALYAFGDYRIAGCTRSFISLAGGIWEGSD